MQTLTLHENLTFKSHITGLESKAYKQQNEDAPMLIIRDWNKDDVDSVPSLCLCTLLGVDRSEPLVYYLCASSVPQTQNGLCTCHGALPTE